VKGDQQFGLEELALFSAQRKLAIEISFIHIWSTEVVLASLESFDSFILQLIA
jgi:hypothetical protein